VAEPNGPRRFPPARLQNFFQVTILNLVLCSLVLIAAEVLMRACGYTVPTQKPQAAAAEEPRQFGRALYPRWHFQKHPQAGFDIAPDFPPTPFRFPSGTVTIFSNRLGCFDRNEAVESEYVLLLGDSYAWGYAEYEEKLGSVLERLLEQPVAKCGITHSGQRHQLIKGREVVQQLGRAPERILVTYYQNDPTDDHLFPHATVFEGYLADQATLVEGRVVRFDETEIRARYEQFLRGEAAAKNVAEDRSLDASLRDRLVKFLKEHSVVANAVRDAIRIVYGGALFRQEKREVPWSAEHEQALVAMQAWADSLGAGLLLVLVPPKDLSFDHYERVRAFLSERQIAFVDLRPGFLAAHEEPIEAFYWPDDGHWNGAGNRLAAELVADHLARE
jgi:hypothetical protein